METQDKYKELETKFGPHTAELQRRFDYDKKYLGLVDVKFFVDDEAIAKAKAEGKTTEQLVEEMAQESIRMKESHAAPDPDFF